MRNKPLEDTSLLSAIQKGDRSAFDVLFQKYYSVLCTYCYRFVRLEDAEEIVQDVMLWLWENRERPIVEYSLKQYLFKAVYHRCMTRIAQNEVKQRADTAYYERMFTMLQEVDIYQNLHSLHLQPTPSYTLFLLQHIHAILPSDSLFWLLLFAAKVVSSMVETHQVDDETFHFV